MIESRRKRSPQHLPAAYSREFQILKSRVLPGTLRITEVDLHILSYPKVLVFRHLQSGSPT